jgi:transcriptional/translational regulatory protein YebC/TACO1
MSGHSKWRQIKRKKEATDAKRGQEFTRLAMHIKQAARAGTDPATNAALAEAIAHAKRANMPQANIDRLLSATNTPTSEIVYEAFGPAGAALLIIARTDNNRRTVAEIRRILKGHGGSLGTHGSVIWKFTRQPEGYTPQYPQNLPPAAREEITQLTRELGTIADIEQVVTDAVE